MSMDEGTKEGTSLISILMFMFCRLFTASIFMNIMFCTTTLMNIRMIFVQPTYNSPCYVSTYFYQNDAIMLRCCTLLSTITRINKKKKKKQKWLYVVEIISMVWTRCESCMATDLLEWNSLLFCSMIFHRKVCIVCFHLFEANFFIETN